MLGGATAQRAVFGLLASRFDVAAGAGFDGAIVFDLGASDGTRRCWTIEVRRGRARAEGLLGAGGPGPDHAALRWPTSSGSSAGAGSFYALVAVRLGTDPG